MSAPLADSETQMQLLHEPQDSTQNSEAAAATGNAKESVVTVARPMCYLGDDESNEEQLEHR